ncbi:hypothetical protein ACFVQ0_17065 [Streptomyces sp. NPDC057900]|uniref:hypothetical protein n=1 Tax=Streptomyces sp. NPDC057900 TaxID=3346274 RepID=UPI0036E1AF50
MSDFHDRGPAHRDPAGPRGQGGQRPRRRGEGPGTVHQAVFRWEGNQGRQGTGMKAVAHSCPAELADELGRELGPLLWVSGTAAPYPSVVRTRTADDRIMLVRRWPTTDRGGRPSTVSHALIGDARSLGTEICLGLAYGKWISPRESAEQASGDLKLVPLSRLKPLASQQLPGMTNQLASVRRTLILVAAEWLRDPEQRVSLLTDEVDPGGGLDRADVPLVYLGLYRLFGSWLGRDWTFATYDTSDTHQLRLMCVSRWEPDAGGSGPLARVTGRLTGGQKFEHAAAAQLVNHLLAHPTAAPGVPQLTELLKDGAALDWHRRRALLQEILSLPGPRRGDRPAAAPEPPRAPDPEPEPEQDPDPGYDALPPAEPPEPLPEPAAPPPPAVPPAHSPRTQPPPSSPHRGEPPVSGYPRLPGGYTPAAAARETTLREALRRGDTAGHRALAERLRTVPDEELLAELRSGRLPQASLELLLNELGRAGRTSDRPDPVRHELCGEVLRNGLYFTPNRPGAEAVSRMALAEQSAALFTWAVAPLARDERYLLDLQELVHHTSRDRDPRAADWLWQHITDPPGGSAPDLPPALWLHILRAKDTRTTPVPYLTSPSPSPSPAPTATLAPAPAPVAVSPSPPRKPPGQWSQVTELANNVGCVLGCAVLLLAVLIAIVVASV